MSAMRIGLLPVILATLVLLAGCVPWINFQSPEVLAPRQSSVSLGYCPPLAGELSYRHSLNNDADFGVKFSYAGILPSLMVDVKREVLHGRATGSLVGGLLVVGKKGAGVYPGFLLGSRRVYAGLFAPAVLTWPEHRYWNWGWFAAPHVVAGASFGRRLRLIPEVAIGYWMPDPAPVGYLGVAVQYTF